MRRCNTSPCWLGRRTLEFDICDEEFLCDPGYFLYYYSHRPLDPRLPPPLFKSHFPGYLPLLEQLGCNPEIQIENVEEPEIKLKITESNENKPETKPDLGVLVNAELKELCKNEDATIQCGSALLAFHISHAKAQEHRMAANQNINEGSRRSVKDNQSEQSSLKPSRSTHSTFGSEDTEHDLDTQSSDVLSYIGEYNDDSRMTATTSPDRIPPRIMPMVPKTYDGRLQFLTQPITEACGTVQCILIRERKKIASCRYILALEVPSYPYVVMDRSGAEHVEGNLERTKELFLLAARQQKGASKTSFSISMDRDDFDKHGKNYLAKCRKNLSNLDFTILQREDPNTQKKVELGAIAFTQGTKYLPSQVQVVLPAVNEENALDIKDPKWLLQKFKEGKCDRNPIMKNTQPVWNQEAKTYEVDFGGRVTKSSSKNIQLQDVTTSRPSVKLTFGKVDENRFALDFAYPFTPVMAFAVALSCFDAL